MARIIDLTKNPLLGGVPVGEAFPKELGRGGLDIRYLLTIKDRLQLH
jgi:hypothetical protein